jgi:hypothetical protein
MPYAAPLAAVSWVHTRGVCRPRNRHDILGKHGGGNYFSSIMNSAVTSFLPCDPAAILDRHTIRRITGVPTVSLLVGPVGAGGGTWRRWAAAMGRSVVVANRNLFPYEEWVRSVAERKDVPAAAVRCLAQRAERDPDEFLASWQAKTPADRERFWSTLAPSVDDNLLRMVASLAVTRSPPSMLAASLSDLGEEIVPMIVRLAPSAMWPGVLFLSSSTDDFSSVGHVAATWAVRVPAVAIAVAVPV